jgi:hypothetical protein
MNTSIDHKRSIIHTFSEWTAFSSTRSGCSLKARRDVYPLIRIPDYAFVLDGQKSIDPREFVNWHEKYINKIVKLRPQLTVGWASKLINIYLKCMVYGAGYGRPGLKDCIHPPIDGGLWKGIKESYRERPDILAKTHSKKYINNIETYADYTTTIDGLRMIAEIENCTLFEVEHHWKGTDY